MNRKTFQRWRKSSGFLRGGVLLVLVVVLGTLRMPDLSTAAGGQPVFGPACGTATVDGLVDATEWVNAASQTFQMVVPGTGTPFTATLKVMNDTHNLYYAFTINDDELSTYGQYLPRGDSINIYFDNDHSGALFQPDDDVLGLYAGAPHFEDKYIVGTPALRSNNSDTLGGGSTDGNAAVQRVSALNHFEGQHPLCSGDTLDFCLHPGDTVGLQVEYLDAEGDGSFGGSQFYPGNGSMDEIAIVIGDCPVTLSNFVFLPLVVNNP